VLTILLLIFGFAALLIGMAGCVLPVIPGPLVAFLSLVIMDLAKDWQAFPMTFLLVMGIIALLLSLLLDYLVSLAGARKYGASRAGLWGSVIGMLIGVIFFPPLGIFLGALVGAVVAEVLVGKKTGQAMRVGWGIFLGNMVGIVIKFAYCLMVLFFYIKELI
jgi:hypothetical protein